MKTKHVFCDLSKPGLKVRFVGPDTPAIRFERLTPSEAEKRFAESMKRLKGECPLCHLGVPKRLVSHGRV